MFRAENVPQVGSVMGSLSDREVVAPAAVLDGFGVPWEWRVLSAHRSPEAVAAYAEAAEARGLRVLIAAAGGAAHLPGVLAAQTVLPAIGIRGGGRHLGLDAQMPPGTPVAAVGVDGAKDAVLAVAILALSQPDLAERLKPEAVAETDRQLQEGIAPR